MLSITGSRKKKKAARDTAGGYPAHAHAYPTRHSRRNESEYGDDLY